MRTDLALLRSHVHELHGQGLAALCDHLEAGNVKRATHLGGKISAYKEILHGLKALEGGDDFHRDPLEYYIKFSKGHLHADQEAAKEPAENDDPDLRGLQ